MKYHYFISGNKSEHLFVKVGSILESSFINILGITVVANVKFNIHEDSIIKRAWRKVIILAWKKSSKTSSVIQSPQNFIKNVIQLYRMMFWMTDDALDDFLDWITLTLSYTLYSLAYILYTYHTPSTPCHTLCTP